jgi:DNA-binding IclR family transcriptional regulator
MINSILKALDILSLFSPTESRMSLATISNKMNLPKSTVHNLLATLVHRGFIERVDNDQYALGTTVIVLAQAARVNVELRDRAAPLLSEVAETCHESVYLTTREEDNILYIYAIESPRRLLARTAIGDRVPMHCTANGKATLAYLPEDEITQFIDRTRLPVFTDNTIHDPVILRQELELTKSRGYGLDNEEHELATFCVGAPIFDSNVRVVGACSISGEDPQITGARLPELAALIKRTAQEISRRMGYVPSAPSQVFTILKNI